jgi:hypothetical protein
MDLSPQEEVFAQALQELDARPMVPRARRERTGGEQYLDTYRWNNLAILHDDDGEWFAAAVEKAVSGDIDWITDSLYSGFYEGFNDDYQYVTFLILRDLSLFFAFYQPYSNDVYGIGYDSIYAGEVFDTTDDTQVDGIIFMNYWGLWYEDEYAGHYVFGQEFMHRWGAFTNVSHDSLDQDALLGRDAAHWSYWLDTPNSPMEGNDWEDNGDGTWTIDTDTTPGYSDLDLYLMGFAGADEVGAQTFLAVSEDEQDRVNREAASTPEAFADEQGDRTNAITVAATPVEFGVDAIIAAEGERSPGVDESPRAFRMAFVVLVLDGDDASDETLGKIDELRERWEAGWDADVGYRADLDTTLADGSAPSWPPDTGATDTGSPDTGTPADSEDTGNPGTVEFAEAAPPADAAGCGCASARPAGGIAALVASLAGLVRRRGWGR